MPSFDIANKIDHQTLDNALNNVRKEIQNRFDFKGSKTELELDKKSMSLLVTSENDMKIKTLEDIILTRAIKQNIDGKVFDFTQTPYASGAFTKKEIKIREGIDKEVAKKIVKIIKDSKIKVEAAIMDSQVRVSAKKIDDLQAVIALLRRSDIEIPLQFTNMKS